MCKNNVHFITFSNTSSNFSVDRIKYEASQMDCFDTITSYSEMDFDNEYWEKNKTHFDNTRGYGYWSWKPYFILKKLKEINNGDTVVYADTGCSFVRKNRNILIQWITISQKSTSGILSPCYGPFKEINWTKFDAYDYINKTYNVNKVDIYFNAVQCGAGILFVTKNEKSIRFIENWNDVMSNHFNLCTDQESKLKNPSQFREHRHDQSIFSMLSKIYGIETISSYDGILNKNSPILCTRCRNDKNTWKKPITVAYDYQIFDIQKFGGISRVFTEMVKIQSRNEIIENFNGGESSGKYPDILPKITLLKTENENFKDLNICPTECEMTNREFTEQIIKQGNFDIFFPTFFDSSIVDLVKNKHIVVFIPDMISEIYPNIFGTSHPYIIGKRKIAMKADAIFTASQNSKKDIVRIFNIDENKIHVIPHGISDDFGRQIYKKSFFDFPYVLYVGERENYKNFNLFLKHASKTILKYDNLKIVCTGKPFTNLELQIIQQHGLQDRVVQGFVQNNLQMATLYYYAKMFIFPSDYEGFGIPILESYEMKCPVLLNNKSCFPEIAGDAAVFFDMTVEKSNIGEKIDYIMNMSDTERLNLIQKQTNRLKMYNWKNASDIMTNVFNKICDTNLDVFSYFVGDKYNDTNVMLDWYHNMKQFYCTEMNRRFVIVTDNNNILNIIGQSKDVKLILIKPIESLDARKLIKFNLIQYYFDNNEHSQKFSFIQSNCRCNTLISYDELTNGKKFSANKSCYFERGDSFDWLYCNVSSSVTNITSNTSNFTYFQAGHFVGDVQFVKNMSEWILNAIQQDSSNGVRTRWHDETYFNYYLNVVYKDNCDINIIKGSQYLSAFDTTSKIVAVNKEALWNKLIK